MKRVISILLCFLLSVVSLAGCSVDNGEITTSFDKDKIEQSVIQGNTQFAFNIFKRLNTEDEGKNIFISPLSISTALTMTYEGARGTTKDAMADALCYAGIDIAILNDSYQNLLRYLKQSDSKIDLDINNSIWVRDGKEIEKEFLDTNKDVFDAYVTEIDFSSEKAADEVNKWISDSTKGKIKKMIEPPIPQSVVMYLINAIYFKGDWTEKFDKERTFNSRFSIAQGNTEDIMMMNKKGDVEYGEGDDFKVVRLPYGDGKTSMYCILPQEDIAIDDFVSTMHNEKWKDIKASISETEDVILQIPRFKIEYGIKKLNDSLIGLGMEEAFSMSADFSGIRDGIYISRVLHKAVIEVNEEGSEAAGVTVVEMKESCEMNPIMFIANRPFMFIIANDEYDTILFMGKMCTMK